MRNYDSAAIQPLIAVTVSLLPQYRQYGKEGFGAERHAHWELMYIDKGQARIRVDDAVYAVEEGEVLLYGPGVSHASVGNWENVRAGFVGFICEGNEAHVLENRTIRPGAAGRHLLADLFAEGALYPESVPEEDTQIDRCLREDRAAYARQIVRSRTELLLLRLYEQLEDSAGVSHSGKTEKNNAVLGERITAYVRENINAPAPAEEAAAALGVSASRLKVVCREQLGCSFRSYFAEERLKEAKRLIRQGLASAEIAACLGYSSVYYFSEHFKKETGMTPSEYGKQLK